MSTRRWRLVAALILATCGGLLVWQSFSRVPDTPIPTPDLSSTPADVASAVAAARKKVQADPRSAKAWGELGMVFYAHQFETEANKCLAHAAQLDPDEFRWPYLLGTSLAVADPHAAEIQFRRALELRNDFAVAHLRLGELLLNSERFSEAAAEFEAAYRLDGGEPRTHYDVARMFLAQGDAAAALPWAEGAARLAPDVKSVHELLASVHQRLGNRDQAVAELELADQAFTSSLGWNDPVAAEVLARRVDLAWQIEHAESLLGANQTQEAIRVLRSAVRRDNRNPRAYVLLARALVKADQITEAEELLGEAVVRHPEASEIWFQRGVAAYFGERFADATQFFEKAVALKPDYALGFYNLGHAWLKLNEDEKALQAFETAARLRPSYADAHTNVGKLWLKQGDKTKASEALQRALQLKPKDEEARKLLKMTEENTSR